MKLPLPRSTGRMEAIGLLILAVVYIGFLVPALITARKEARDGVRRDDLTALKNALEQYQNVAQAYPAAPREPRVGCAVSRETDWFFGSSSPLRQKKLFPARMIDTDSGRRYEYCVVEGDTHGATAWYLRTRLENLHASESGFDSEGGHNYWFRTVREGRTTFFDICGGTFRCGASSEEVQRIEQES